MKRASSFRDRLASADPDESAGVEPAPQNIASQKLSSKHDMRSRTALREGWVLKLPVRDKHAISGFRRRYLRLMPPDQLEWWLEEPSPTTNPKGSLELTDKTTVQVRSVTKGGDCAKADCGQKEATIMSGDLKLVIRAAPPPGKPSDEEEEADEVQQWCTFVQTQVSQLHALRTTDRMSSISGAEAIGNLAISP